MASYTLVFELGRKVSCWNEHVRPQSVAVFDQKDVIIWYGNFKNLLDLACNTSIGIDSTRINVVLAMLDSVSNAVLFTESVGVLTYP